MGVSFCDLLLRRGDMLIICINSYEEAQVLNKLIRKAGSVVGSGLVTLEEVVKQRIPTKLLTVMEKLLPPLTFKLWAFWGAAFATLIQPCCYKEQYRMSYLPSAIRLFIYL